MPIFTKIENVHKSIILLQPLYHNGANATELILGGGNPPDSYIDRRTISSVKKALARSYAVDLAAQADILRRDFDRHPPLPFFLPDNRVFIPLKMRIPRVRRDSAYGFVDVNHIRGCRRCAGSTEISLSTGARVKIFSSLSTVQTNIYLGWQIRQNSRRAEKSEEETVLEAARIIIHKLESIEACFNKININRN